MYEYVKEWTRIRPALALPRTKSIILDELHNLYSWSSIIRMVKSRRMRLAGHVAGIDKIGTHVFY
jgi:hypothetical protein